MRDLGDPYEAAAARLRAEGFAFDARTCFYERGRERLTLRWNGRVYARRRAPPKPPERGGEVVDLASHFRPSPD